jgi:hypothetical protein
MNKNLIKKAILILLMIYSAYTFIEMYDNLGNIINNTGKKVVTSGNPNLNLNLDLKTDQQKYLEDNYISKDIFYVWQVQFLQLIFCLFILIGSFIMLYVDALKEWEGWKNEIK